MSARQTAPARGSAVSTRRNRRTVRPVRSGQAVCRAALAKAVAVSLRSVRSSARRSRTNGSDSSSSGSNSASRRATRCSSPSAVSSPRAAAARCSHRSTTTGPAARPSTPPGRPTTYEEAARGVNSGSSTRRTACSATRRLPAAAVGSARGHSSAASRSRRIPVLPVSASALSSRREPGRTQRSSGTTRPPRTTRKPPISWMSTRSAAVDVKALPPRAPDWIRAR